MMFLHIPVVWCVGLDDVSLPAFSLACVASVSVLFRSKERPRNEILGFGRPRNETRGKK